MHSILEIQRATTDARKRLGDNTIGTRLEAGRVQVVRVTYPDGDAEIEAVSDWMPLADVCGYLDKMA